MPLRYNKKHEKDGKKQKAGRYFILKNTNPVWVCGNPKAVA